MIDIVYNATEGEETEEYLHLKDLNEQQLEAVMTTDGPLLVLAGAGTGKTRVLTSRIVHIVKSRLAFPSQVMAVTFTNKAAREMKTRVEQNLGNSLEGMYIGTFHAIASKILRRHAELVGLTRDFIIIDYDDQLKLAKRLIAERNLDEKKYPAKTLLYLISRYKDKAWTIDRVPASEMGLFAASDLAALYNNYQNTLISHNAVDFGDLLVHNIHIFNNYPDVLAEYQRKLRYILVDEYQDTNTAQYLWLRLLAQGHQNICCVGDDDQSIYGWRGAEVSNILRFDKDFSGAKVIRLEQNYRSKNNILIAATKVISNNETRHGKTLWSSSDSGMKIKLNSFYDDREEARFIAEEVEALVKLYKVPYSQIAVLIRAGYQSRGFEESFNFFRIPYRIIGGLKFYERMEVKDALGYVRLLLNPQDNLAFERIINTPKRGVGTGSLQKIYEYGQANSLSHLQSALELVSIGEIKGKTAGEIKKCIELINHWRLQLKTMSHWQVVENLLNDSGYIAYWQQEKTEESRERLDNIKELLRSIQEYGDLYEYIEHLSLLMDNDTAGETEAVSVMTMHAAKGLEFEAVFLTGWEDGLFPSQRAMDENGKSGLEEERRLAYVGITRARERLYISFANNRRIYGGFQASVPSRFIDELPKETYEIINNVGSFYKSKEPTQIRPIDIKKKIMSQESSSKSEFRGGDKVWHEKFGAGIVVSAQDKMADVAFPKIGIKKLMTSYIKKTN